MRFDRLICLIRTVVIPIGLATAANVATAAVDDKGIVVWNNTAFGQAAEPTSNNAWKEFKDFIADPAAGLGGTIYKDCSDGYFIHYTDGFTAAIRYFAGLPTTVRVSPGFSMIGCTDPDCGVVNAQAIVNYVANLDSSDANYLASKLDGHLEMWIDFEPTTPADVPVYFTALQTIRGIVDAHNASRGARLQISLTAFLPMRLHSSTPDDFRLPCPLPDGTTELMYVSDCLQTHYLDASILMAYRNTACYETSCHALTDGSTCLSCWNSQSHDMHGCFGMLAWSTVFAEGAAGGNGEFSIAIETDPTVGSAWEISFGQPNLRGNIAYLDSQVDLTITTLQGSSYASSLAQNPVVVHDYEHFFCFMNNQMPKGFTVDCPTGTATTCDPTMSFEHADLNYDGIVSAADLAIIHAAMGSCEGDLDGNGFVDGGDVGILIGAWGPCLP